MRRFIFSILSILFIHYSFGQAIKNPIINKDFPDPTIIYTEGFYYAYATNSNIDDKLAHIQVARSKDLQNWTILGDALPEKPSWADRDFWAPHVLFDSALNQFVLFYSGESGNGKCLGVAYAKHPAGPFKDSGEPLLCGEGFVNIDPMAFIDPKTKKKLLYWGSGHAPIKVQEMTDDWSAFREGSKSIDVMHPGQEAQYDKLIEGAWVDYHQGYYYLYYSGDNCCGSQASYAVMIARARNPFGPFERLGSNNHSNRSVLLEKDSLWLAPGHNSIFRDPKGNIFIAYHAIPINPNTGKPDGYGRVALIKRIHYREGWPKIEDASTHSAPLTLADPHIFYDNGTYYLYGTGAPDGFQVYSSVDLENWTGPVGRDRNGYALHKDHTFGTMGFWAPQVFKYKNRFYMAYTANEQIAIASSDSPLGPFTQDTKRALNGPTKQIDPFIFFDKNKAYLYFVRLQDGNRIYCAELSNDLSQIKEETASECLRADEPWENTSDARWPVTEGPTVIKHAGLYYLLYSANDFRNPDYAVGYATSSHPMGPWKKHRGNPIISKRLIGEDGAGHGDLIQDKQGNLHYVFHTHFKNGQVAPRKTAFIGLKFKHSGNPRILQVDSNSFRFLTVGIK